MKIICVEEHIIDQDLAKAGQPRREADAPYFTEVGSDDSGAMEDGDEQRPLPMDTSVTLKLAAEAGEQRLAQMDKHGIDMQILSCSNPPQDAPAEQALELTRAVNDKLAVMVRANPTRFAAFASLPWQHPEAAVEELERTVKKLGFVGTMLLGRPGNDFLDDPRFDPILAKLDELRVPIYIHPGYPLPQVQQPYYGSLKKEVTARLSLFGWGWHNEAGVQLLRVILSGAFDRFPNLQVISGHWGEMIPFYLQRLDDMIPPQVSGLSRTISETFKRHVYVTPSGMMYLPHFEFIRKVVGEDRILYSIDYPYLTMAGARRFLETLPISQGGKDKIAHTNAEKLFDI